MPRPVVRQKYIVVCPTGAKGEEMLEEIKAWMEEEPNVDLKQWLQQYLVGAPLDLIIRVLQTDADVDWKELFQTDWAAEVWLDEWDPGHLVGVVRSTAISHCLQQAESVELAYMEVWQFAVNGREVWATPHDEFSQVGGALFRLNAEDQDAAVYHTVIPEITVETIAALN